MRRACGLKPYQKHKSAVKPFITAAIACNPLYQENAPHLHRDMARFGMPPIVVKSLSNRQDILIAEGLTNSAIAERIVLSPKTVRNYITEIFSKLQVADRAQAIIRARNAGLG